MNESRPPSITIRRRLQWMDTDAADRWHHAVLIRWAEEGEAELHRAIGVVDETFGATPRVALSLDYTAAVRFDDEVDITFRVERVGTTSVTYAFEASLVDGPRVGGGEVVTVFTGPGMATTPWPDHLRAALEGTGAHGAADPG